MLYCEVNYTTDGSRYFKISLACVFPFCYMFQNYHVVKFNRDQKRIYLPIEDYYITGRCKGKNTIWGIV